jgi:hypothetical protein
MSPIIIMDQNRYGSMGPGPQAIEYRLPEDKPSFWTGTYPTAAPVRAFMCSSCGRIALYGSGEPNA